MPNTILLKGEVLRKEGVTDEAVTPGELMERGGSNDVQAATSGNSATAAVIFALENDLVGDGIADDYDSGDTVQLGYPEPGAEVYAFLAYGDNVSVGAALESSGNGELTAHSSGRVIGYALEAVNNTTTSGADRIQIEVA